MRKLLLMALLCLGVNLVAQNVPLELTSPNGGEQWQAGSQQMITWSQQNLSGAVSLHLISPLDNQPPLPIAMNIPVQAEQFQWLIPLNIMPADFYQVMISLSSNAGTGIFDTSDAPFSILGSDPPPPPQVHVTVLNPNGGEVWTLGSTQMINWTSQGLDGEVVITLVQANGVADYQIASGVPIGSGSFLWTVPDNVQPGGGYRVHVMWLSNLTVYFGDLSDGTFSIVGSDPPPPPPQMLQLISPNGGETWMAGTMHPITWVQGFNAIHPVTIELHNGLNSTVAPILIASGIPSFPSVFHWTIPATLVPSDQYYIRIFTLIADGTIFGDYSDAPFTVMSPDPPPNQVFYLTSPNGGETWVAGTMHPITWVPGFNAIWPISLMLHNGMDPNSAPIPIAVDIPSFPSTFHWMIPADLMPSNHCFIQISTILPDGMLLSDFSDGPFSIESSNPPPPPNQILQIISPNGGETWMAGTIHPIRWIGHQVQGPFELALMRGDNIQPALVIAPAIPNLGNFRWMIPSNLEPANDYRMRIRMLNGNLIDLSDAPFTILANQPPPPSDVTLITPNGGEIWSIGNTHTITWNAPNLNAPMQIWLLREGQRERYRHIISPNVPNTGSFEWTIPPRVPPGDNYKILVRAINPAWQRDLSDAVFSIVANTPKLKAAPTKAGDAVTISLDSQNSVSALVVIYNIRGQKVRDLGTLNLGSSRSVIWDARDDRGQKASPGLYLIRVRLEREILSQRVLLRK